MQRRRTLPWPLGINSTGEEQADLDSLTAPIPVIFFNHCHSSSSTFSLSRYMGPHGGVVPSLKPMAWSYAECSSSTKDASVVMMYINTLYSLGTRSMAAWSSSSVPAAQVRCGVLCGSSGNLSWLSLVNRLWQLAEVNLMRRLRACRSYLCFASHQRGTIVS